MDEISSESSDFSEYSLPISSDSDSELDILYADRKRPKNENYVEETAVRYSDMEFIEHFRVSRNVANDLAERFQASDYFKHHKGEFEKISHFKHTLVFLWYAGHETSSFRDVADRFCITMSCLWRIIHRITYFISNELTPIVIKWPTAEEQVHIERHFREKNFPGVVGVIDGTQIRIDKPKDDPDSYLNRKHYFSIQAQVACDHERYIRSIFIGYPGSVHDSRVFRTSPLFNTLEEKCGDRYLLGDSGYPCLKQLISPFRDRGQLRPRELEYNRRLCKNRYIIEHCFGILKQKFRQLFHIRMRKIDIVVHLIRACFVLHNLAIKDEFPYEDQDIHAQINMNKFVYGPLGADNEDNRDGIQTRNHVANNLLPHY